MKKFTIVLLVGLFVSLSSFAQVASPTPTPSPTPVVNVLGASIPASPAASVVAAAAPSVPAPPAWATDILVQVEKLPVVGPILSQALVYAGAIVPILTALVAFMLASISALSKVFSSAGLSGFATQLEAFNSGPIMYWLQYFSMFNAQKPAVVASAASQSPPA